MHFPTRLTKVLTFQDLLHHRLVWNQTICQIPIGEYFLPTVKRLGPAILDSLQSYSDVLPCFDSHSVGTALHDLTTPQDNVGSFPSQWCSNLY